jgi:hypothetical protein
MDCYLKEDSASYDTLRNQTNLGGNGPAAVPVKIIEGFTIEFLIGSIISSKKETLRHMILRSQTHLGGNGPAAVPIKVVEGLAIEFNLILLLLLLLLLVRIRHGLL